MKQNSELSDELAITFPQNQQTNRAVCSGVLETFNSATDDIISDNWKFTLFNYVSEQIEVIIHVPKEHVRDQMY